jgi:hypothetical protein
VTLRKLPVELTDTVKQQDDWLDLLSSHSMLKSTLEPVITRTLSHYIQLFQPHTRKE